MLENKVTTTTRSKVPRYQIEEGSDVSITPLRHPRTTCGVYVVNSLRKVTRKYVHKHPRKQGSWGQHGAHLGPTGPRWAPCWPHESCYPGYDLCRWNFMAMPSTEIAFFRRYNRPLAPDICRLIDVDWAHITWHGWMAQSPQRLCRLCGPWEKSVLTCLKLDHCFLDLWKQIAIKHQIKIRPFIFKKMLSRCAIKNIPYIG